MTLLLLHITVALSSVIFTTYVFFFPSRPKLQITYLLTGATFASGTYLTLINPAHIVEACVTGLVYIGIMLVGIVATRNKLNTIALAE